MGIWKIMSHFHTLYNSKTAVGICKYFFADRKKDDKICAWKSRWQVSDAVSGTGCSGQFELISLCPFLLLRWKGHFVS